MPHAEASKHQERSACTRLRGTLAGKRLPSKWFLSISRLVVCFHLCHDKSNVANMHDTTAYPTLIDPPSWHVQPQNLNPTCRPGILWRS